MIPSTDMATYYARRAAEFEAVYDKPERQADLDVLKHAIPRMLAGRRVLEVACGTGYWTQFIAPAAEFVLAADVSDDVLAHARRKPLPVGRVRFSREDAFAPPVRDERFTAAFVGFFWSHIARARLRPWLEMLHAGLAADAVVVIVDNTYVEGSSSPVDRVDEHGDSFQRRRLADGGEFEVLKNFFTPEEVGRVLEGLAAEVRFLDLRYYWCVSYKPRPRQP